MAEGVVVSAELRKVMQKPLVKVRVPCAGGVPSHCVAVEARSAPGGPWALPSRLWGLSTALRTADVLIIRRGMGTQRRGLG